MFHLNRASDSPPTTIDHGADVRGGKLHGGSFGGHQSRLHLHRNPKPVFTLISVHLWPLPGAEGPIIFDHASKWLYNPNLGIIGFNRDRPNAPARMHSGTMKPVVLHQEVRPRLAMRPGCVARRNGEYRRCGTANVFCGVEPKAGR
jgi:hypothetical protein